MSTMIDGTEKGESKHVTIGYIQSPRQRVRLRGTRMQQTRHTVKANPRSSSAGHPSPTSRICEAHTRRVKFAARAAKHGIDGGSALEMAVC